MPDPLSPIQRTVMLRRIDPERGMARFYSLMIERDLFGTVRLVRHWGRISMSWRSAEVSAHPRRAVEACRPGEGAPDQASP